MGTCKTSLRKSTQLTKVSLICPWGSRESWKEKDFLHSRVLILSICPLIWKLLPGSLMFHACSNDRDGKILLLFITPCRVPAGKSVLPIDNFSKMSNSSSIVQQILMSHFSFYRRNQNSTISLKPSGALQSEYQVRTPFLMKKNSASGISMESTISSFGPLNQFIILQEPFTPNSNTSSLILLSASGTQYDLFFRLDCSMWLEGKSLHIFNLIELLFIFQKMSENEIRYVCSQLLVLLSYTYIIYLVIFSSFRLKF